jgi:acyl-CoA thioesterase
MRGREKRRKKEMQRQVQLPLVSKTGPHPHKHQPDSKSARVQEPRHPNFSHSVVSHVLLYRSEIMLMEQFILIVLLY